MIIDILSLYVASIQHFEAELTRFDNELTDFFLSHSKKKRVKVVLRKVLVFLNLLILL